MKGRVTHGTGRHIDIALPLYHLQRSEMPRRKPDETSHA